MIVVTGATGLLGSHLLFSLTDKQEAIRGLYRSSEKIEQVRKLFHYYDPSNAEARFNLIQWKECDILDIPKLESCIHEGDHVYHCAALVSFDKKDFKTLIRINRRGTENVVNVCLAKGARKLCHVSSTAALGGMDDPITEKTNWKNGPDVSGYSVSKYSAEKEVWRGIEEGLEAVIVNPCVILGAGSWDDSSLAIFKQVEKGISRYPSGSNATVDARDVAEIMIKLMDADISAQRYLCIGSNQSFKDLTTEIAVQLNRKPPSKPAPKSMVKAVKLITDPFLFILGKRSVITRDTLVSLFSDRRYSNEKVRLALNFEFRDLKEQVRNGIAGRIK